MARDRAKIGDLVYILLIALAVSAGIVIAFERQIPLSILTAYGAGLCFYGILIVLSRADADIDADYIQTGEAPIAALALYIIVSFISDNLFLLVPGVFLCCLIYEIYLKFVISSAKREIVINGIIMHGVMASIILLRMVKTGTADARVFKSVFMGYAAGVNPSPAATASLIAGAGVIALLLFLLGPEIKTFSQGKAFSKFAGFNFRTTNIIMLIARSCALTAVILFMGWLGGTGYYLGSILKGPLAGVKTLLTVTFILLVYAVTAEILSPWCCLLLSVTASYILFYLLHLKRKKLYDRTH